MSVWNTYPDLNPAEFRALVAVTAQILSEFAGGSADVSSEILQQSVRSSARALAPLLSEAGSTITNDSARALLEDEERAMQACRAVLDQVQGYPPLAQRVAEEYARRQQKMTGVEVMLLAGALLVLALRIKHMEWGSFKIDFAPANKAVQNVVTGLIKGAGLGS